MSDLRERVDMFVCGLRGFVVELWKTKASLGPRCLGFGYDKEEMSNSGELIRVDIK